MTVGCVSVQNLEKMKKCTFQQPLTN